MNYREPKQVTIRDRERFYLVPIPSADGFWMLCHPAVMAPCPACGAKAGVPCISNRGHVVLTGRMAASMLEVLEDRSSARNVGELRHALSNPLLYRSRPHEKRRLKWRELGLNNSGSRKGAVALDYVRQLTRLHAKTTVALEKLERKMRQCL